MHIILGAGGPIANGLTRHLVNHGVPVRLVSRSPIVPDTPSVHWRGADLLDRRAIVDVTRGAEVIYLTAGLVYDADVWATQWPIIMDNVLAAARTHDARLLFFDNVYMYGPMDRPITEESPCRPVSRKGEIRARVADTLLEAVRKGEVRATIARAPDFYGTTSTNSFLDSMVINRAAAGQRPLWIGDKNRLHNFTFVPDAARGLFLLGQHPEHDGQIWHLPTPDPVTGHAMLDHVAEVFGSRRTPVPIKKWMLRLLGPFDPAVKGSVEMYYQYDRDYRFDSGKFQRAFAVEPTPYREALESIRDRNPANQPSPRDTGGVPVTAG